VPTSKFQGALPPPHDNKSPNPKGKAGPENVPTSKLPGSLPAPHKHKSPHSKGKVGPDLSRSAQWSPRPGPPFRRGGPLRCLGFRAPTGMAPPLRTAAASRAPRGSAGARIWSEVVGCGIWELRPRVRFLLLAPSATGTAPDPSTRSWTFS